MIRLRAAILACFAASCSSEVTSPPGQSTSTGAGGCPPGECAHGGSGGVAGEGGASVGGGGTAGEGGSACSPGSSQICYSGLVGTNGIGLCVTGTQTCTPDGKGYGPCVGEVTPVAETCATPGDDDCDGATNEEGAGCVCTPSATESCYDGPPGTENIGVCKAGTWTCDDQGTSHGPCVGEITPTTDVCSTAADDDCDGANAPCVASTPWSKSFGSMGQYCNVTGLAVDGAGNAILIGNSGGPVDLGGGPVPYGLMIGKFDSLGNHVWSKGVFANGLDVAVDGAGNVLIVGVMGPESFGGPPLAVPPSTLWAFVVKLDPQGNYLWGHAYGSGNSPNEIYSEAQGVATDSMGNVYVGGWFSGATDFGGGPLTPLVASDAFFLKLDPAGNHLWSKQGGTSYACLVESVAVDALDRPVFVGSFTQDMDLGAGPIVSSAVSQDAFAAKLDPGGGQVWLRGFGDPDIQYNVRGGVDPAGNVLLAGGWFGSTDFGAGPVTGSITLAKLESETGAHVWSKGFDGGAAGYVPGVASDPLGNALLTGAFKNQTDFGLGPLVSAGYEDVIVAAYGPGGAAQVTTRFGNVDSNYGQRIATDPNGSVFVAGTFSGSIDFGQGDLIAIGTTDVFVAKLGP